MVHAFGRATPTPTVHVVGINNADAGAMAAETLLARGYRRIGFMGGPEQASTTQDRLAGFLAAAGAQGVSPSISFAGACSFEAGRAEMARLLRGAPDEAYFCGDDVLSIGALSAAQDAGVVVPRDLGIIGLNDMAMAGWANIALTTIHQPFEAIVRASIELIIASFADPGAIPEVRLFPCHIVERKTLCPASRQGWRKSVGRASTQAPWRAAEATAA